ncbi:MULTISPECIES: acyl-CoA dehydrogenase family protein [Cryobacterium]|uniref:Acyl-CoA dehydrogenase n=1 Tax=Cryobacterium luteum TaxID=1424661 RepID=A0A1H8L1D2_9MICO|nr:MULTISPECIES: acyl-CoA dehydrogenase family protein [Cryobacterium]TFB82352.1 acyl-CoA dehydrogenase [Cryobacterium luteum]SEN98990.1 Acyl-CoA dehydrogenase [Cryobacterium luteum]
MTTTFHTKDAESVGIPSNSEEILDAARALQSWLSEQSFRIEQNRKLPNDVVDRLRAAGIFRAAAPATWGGPEMNSIEQTLLVEVIAAGDVSAAWCAMIGMDSGIYSGFLDDGVARQIYESIDSAQSGWIYPHGKAIRVEGGYRISGRWRFGSGITHANVISAGCTVYNEDGTPFTDELSGGPEWRVMLAPAEAYDLIDTWHTTGLAGSGSFDYSVDELFIPKERSFTFNRPVRTGPLYDAPDAILRKMAGVPLGMARAALDHVRGLALDRVDRETGIAWAEDPRVQQTIAQLEMELSAARASVYSTLERQWAALEVDAPRDADARVETALARYNAFRTARSIVQRLYDLVGGAAVYRDRSPLDRWLRDANTMCQHAVAQDSILRLSGKVLLGGDSASPFF